MKKILRIKVCGLTTPGNRAEIEKLPVDFLGFIFYPQSKRFAGDNTDPGLFDTSKNKVAVFVNESIYEIMGLTKNLGFKYVQLHGKETPATCNILKKQGIKVIKAFNVDESFNFETLKSYNNCVNFFLFDTKSNLPGGSGKKFNWHILEKYTGEIPFFLSGGIQPEDAEAICLLDHERLYGVDINSGFEDEPGIKNISKVKTFTDHIQKGLD